MELLTNFTKNIQVNLNISELTSEELSQKIHGEIFKSIENFLPTETENPESNIMNEPIIITQETKEEAMKRLMDRRVQPAKGKLMIPEIAPDIHPMIEKGEVVHEVPHQQQAVQQPTTHNSQPTTDKKSGEKTIASLPDYRYPKGKDPYREPTE